MFETFAQSLPSYFFFLKGLCHKDFAIFGQFCTKIITQCLYSYMKCSYKTIRKISNELYQGELTIIIFLVIIENVASQTHLIIQKGKTKEITTPTVTVVWIPDLN